MDWTLELVVVPVSDVDRAKAFYVEQAGFDLLVDHSAGEDFRVVQLTPAGLGLLDRDHEDEPRWRRERSTACTCSCSDIEAARAELVDAGRRAPASSSTWASSGQTPGLDPERQSYNSFSPSTTPTATPGWSRRSSETEPVA